MLLWVVRFLFAIILIGTAAKFTVFVSERYGWTITASAMLFVLLLALGGAAIGMDAGFPRKKISSISAVYFGLLIGMLLGNLLGLAIGPTLELWASPELVNPISLILTIVLCYICVSVLLQTKDDFRFIIPYVEFSRQVKGGRPIVLDASVILDGRIADIVESGFLDQTLVVPAFVVEELQESADSNDRLRRSRGRRGLDELNRLRRMSSADVRVQEGLREEATPEIRVIRLTQQTGGRLLTADTNLVKLAGIHRVETINIHEVISAMRPRVLAGESVAVHLVREGEEPGQGVGYLDDGTMVVVEMGRNFVGHEVNLVVTRVLQTNTGRLVFGRIDSKNPEPARVQSGRG